MHEWIVVEWRSDLNPFVYDCQCGILVSDGEVVADDLEEFLYGYDTFTAAVPCAGQEGKVSVLDETAFKFAPVVKRIDRFY